MKHPVNMDLDSMKYAELQNLAKELALKANMKADKLRDAIRKHYEQQNEKKEEPGHGDAPPVQENMAQNHIDENNDTSCKEAEVASTTVFVSTRRGKGKATKRKMSVSLKVTEPDVQVAPTAAKDDTGVDASSAVSSTKRRRVSLTKAADKTEAELSAAPPTTCTEQLPEIKARVAKGGKIPRYESLHKRNKTTLKPVTPNFKKLHEAHFNKMESIDSYVQRKTKQMETYKNSVKELKMLSDKTKQQIEGKAEVVKKIRTSLFNPAPVKKVQLEEKRRQTLLSPSTTSLKKPAGKEEVPFRPTVLSTRRINVRFSEATKDNEYKTSLLKTPARMSPCVASSTPQNKAGNAVKPNNDRNSTFSSTKTPGPFVFTANTSTLTTPGTQKKTTFDLKASLSRPLTYKPHKGKLKPFGDAKENGAENKSLILNSHQKNYKQHQVQTREGRRAKQTEDRKQKKAGMLGARRGLVMM